MEDRFTRDCLGIGPAASKCDVVEAEVLDVAGVDTRIVGDERQI
jgi:hypothetical protein